MAQLYIGIHKFSDILLRYSYLVKCCFIVMVFVLLFLLSAGIVRRYAHMTATAVTAGETVTAGQVIGYVGSTGDSTGNHLHFEVMQNGVLVAPVF